MLSAQADPEDPVAFVSPSRRSSMLKKTMRVFGKVKPKFKKQRKPQMELFDSCDSLDFDGLGLENDDDVDDDDDDDGVNATEEVGETDDEEEIEQESSRTEDLEAAEKKIEIQESTKGSQRERAQPSPENKLETQDGARGSQRERGQRSPKPLKEEKEHPAPPDDTVEQPVANEWRRVPRSTKSGEKPKKKHSSSRSRGSGPGVGANHGGAPNSPRRKSARRLSERQHRRSESSPKVSRKDNSKSPCVLPEDKEGGEDNEVTTDEHLKRVSMAFEDDSGMGGYFAKLQDLKHKETSNTHVDDTRISEDEVADTGHEDRASRSFKTPKPIKKLFGMSKSNSKESSKVSPKEKISAASPDPNDTSTEEAAKLMVELSSMLTTPVRNEEHRRPSMVRQKGVVTLGEDDDDDSTLQDFPEVPTEKKTSLSDIRKMMDSTKKEKVLSPVAGKRPTLGSTKSAQDSELQNQGTPRGKNKASPTSVIDGPPVEQTEASEQIRRRASRRSTSNPLEPELTKGHDKGSTLRQQSTSFGSEDDGMTPASARRHRHRPSKRGSSESSSSSSSNSNPQCQQQATDDDTGDQPKQSHAAQRRRRGPRRSEYNRTSSIKDAIPEDAAVDDADATKGQTDEGEIASPGSNRTKRSRRRVSDKRPSHTSKRIDLPLAQSDGGEEKKPHILEEASEDANRVRSPDLEGASQTPFETRRPRPSHQRRSVTDGKKQSDGTGKRGQYSRSVSVNNLKKPHGENPTGLSRKPRAGMQRGMSERRLPSSELGSGVKGTSNEVDERLAQLESCPKPTQSTARKEGAYPVPGVSESEMKQKGPSLAESLERGATKQARLFGDGQYSVSTDDDSSAMFVRGQVSYSCIRSDESVSAPQLVIGPRNTNASTIGVKNI